MRSAARSTHASEDRGADAAGASPPRRRAELAPASMRLNFTAMIDVIFLLLIYFVITANFAVDEGVLSAKLPAAPGLSDSSPKPPQRPLRILVSSAGRYGYRLGIEGLAEAPPDFVALARTLTYLQHDPQRGLRGPYKDDHPVIVAPDGLVRWQHVVNAFNAAVTARYRNVSFARLEEDL